MNEYINIVVVVHSNIAIANTYYIAGKQKKGINEYYENSSLSTHRIHNTV